MSANRPRLLVTDDDPGIVSLLATVGETEGFDVRTATTAAEALRAARLHPPDLVLLDQRMPDVQEFELLRQLRAAMPEASEIVMMTGHGSFDSAVAAVKLGASDYLTKPFDLGRVRRLLARLRQEVACRYTTPATMAGVPAFEGMVGQSAPMQAVYDLVQRLAPHARTVLVTGETGTGKELVAHALHQLGPRHARRFLTVNCSAVVETLFESELFGHARGAFTGASEHKAGLFEAADGGTLFLDEVGELPASVQAKLLRVLESGEVQRVGSVESRRVDVRIVAATNRDLGLEVAAGRFRRDLFYRLNLAEIRLPALRDRPDDLPDLVARFLDETARRLGRPSLRLTAAGERLLAGSRWEGNVRELRNVLERACILAQGATITDRDLAGGMRAPAADVGPAGGATVLRLTPAPLADVEREHIVRTLAQVRGNKAVAARLFGISRRAFYRQLERHGLHQRVPTGPRETGHGPEFAVPMTVDPVEQMERAS